jgi:hypothetical protein
MTAGYDQQVTHARPHHSACSGAAGVLMTASAGPVLTSMAEAAGGVTG